MSLKIASRVVLSLTILSSFSVHPAMADDLTMSAIISEVGRWSSNALLSVFGSKPLIGSTTSPELIVKDNTPTSSLSFDTRVDQNIFNQSAFDTTDLHETAGLSHRNQNWQIGGRFKADYDSTRTSELTNFGLNNIVARHTGLNATPQISYRLNQQDSFALAGDVLYSTYNKNNFTDYATYSVTPSYTRKIDLLNSATFSVQAQRYRSLRGPARIIDAIGPSLGWRAKISPRLTAHAAIGAQTSREYDLGTATGAWQWNYTFASGLTFKGLQDAVDLSAARSQFPHGNGSEALQTSFALNETHAVNPLVSLNAGGSYAFSTYQNQNADNIKTLASGTVGASYHATPHVDVSTSYLYRHETLTNTSASAEDHSVMLALVYRPEEWMP